MAWYDQLFTDLKAGLAAVAADVKTITPRLLPTGGTDGQVLTKDGATAYLTNISNYTPELAEKLKPLIAVEQVLSDLEQKIAALNQREQTLSADEARDRENLTALKGNDAAKRFVEELNRAEDELQAARKDRAALEQQRDAARAQLSALIAQVSFDTDLSVVTQSDQQGSRPPRR